MLVESLEGNRQQTMCRAEEIPGTAKHNCCTLHSNQNKNHVWQHLGQALVPSRRRPFPSLFFFRFNITQEWRCPIRPFTHVPKVRWQILRP